MQQNNCCLLTMKLSKKIIMVMTLILAMSFSLVACGEKEEEEIKYELKAVSKDQLESNNFYVQSGKEYYKLPKGTTNFGDNTIDTSLFVNSDKKTEDTEPITQEEYQDEKNRIISFCPDDVCIPTLYSDQALVFASKDKLPETFTFERFEEVGYSIGSYGMEVISSGKIQLTILSELLYEGSSFKNKIRANEELGAEDVITIGKIDGKDLMEESINENGIIKNLTKNKEYKLDLYLGTKLIKFANTKADVHYFQGLEKYKINEFDYSDSGYITVKIPSDFISGYYYINNIGFVRYIKGNSTDEIDVSKVSMNTPFYYTDEEGNTYTYLDIENKKENNNDNNSNDNNNENNTNETLEIENLDGTVYKNKISIDSSLQNFTVNVNYEDATTTIDGKKITLNDTEVGLPTAKLIDPNGTEYQLKEEDHKLTYNIEGGNMGDWTLELYNCSKRIFEIETVANTGKPDELIHTGSGEQSMNYYVSKTMKDATFTITWEDTTHAANIKIVTPDEKTYGKEETPDQIVSDEYGKVVIKIPEAKYGNYTIKVNGEDLGRVVVNVTK